MQQRTKIMSILDEMSEERFIQLLKDIRSLSDDSFEELISSLQTTGKFPKKNEGDVRQLQLVLMIDKTNTDETHKNN